MPDETLLSQTDTHAVNEQQANASEPVETADAQTADSTGPETAAAESKPEPTPEAEEAGAPESYQAFEFPGGYGVDETILSEYQDWAKQNNFTQDQAQEGINLVSRLKQVELERWGEQQAAWVKDAKGDKEYGGEKFNQNIAVAVKAREAFGTPEFIEMLDSSGLGNHPEMVRFLFRVGSQISEGRMVAGSPNASPRTHESVLYPSMNQ
jgi:hypothetical protein